MAGGLASLTPSADEVYRRTYPRAAANTKRFYERYPGDVARVAALADFILSNDVRLPDGDRLTVKRLQTIGIDLGMGPGLENVHWLIDEAFSAEARPAQRPFPRGGDGGDELQPGPALRRAAGEHLRAGGGGDQLGGQHRARRSCRIRSLARPLLFTGEMMYPWMFEEIRSLRPFRAGAEALAARAEYAPLYDAARLGANEVPVAAVIYHDDLYVDAGLSLGTAAAVGNLTYWITNEYEHDGIRQSANVAKRLMTMVKERGGPRR